MNIHLYHHSDPEDSARLQSIASLLVGLVRKVDAMSVELDGLKAEVTACNATIDSAVVLLNQLYQKILTMKDDPAAMVQLAAEVKAKAGELAAAVAAATPAP